MVRIPDFHCRGPGSIPVWETEILQAAWHGQKKKRKEKKKKERKFDIYTHTMEYYSALKKE